MHISLPVPAKLLPYVICVVVLPCACAHAAPAQAAKTAMPVIDWFSTAPANAGLVRAPKMDLAAPNPDGSEYITVFGRRRRPAAVETPGALLDEPGHIDAAQSFTPFLGDGCTRYTVCTDPGQAGLIDSFGGLIGQH